MKFTNRNIVISPLARIGEGARIGDDCRIYDGVEVGERTTISNDCVLGEPVASYYRDPSYVNAPLTIGSDSLVRSQAIIYSGTTIGSGFNSGHRITIRENTIIGKECRIGTLCDVQDHVKLDDYCWLHSNIFLPAGTILGRFVFVYPNAIFTNDPYPPSEKLAGITVGDYAQIGAGAILLPGIHIGEGALIAAGAIVTKNVEPFALIAGNPAKKIKDVRELKAEDSDAPLYPWPHRFERGMPWQGQGFEQWKETQK